MNKRKVIIDCDPGIDDAFAIALAHYEPSFEIIAIHTVAGNVSIENTTRNARGLAEILDLKAPICQGSGEPLIYEPFFASEVHGHNGFGGVELTDLKPLSPLSAMASYVDILENSTEKVTILAIGPLTNIALLFKAYPHLKSKVDLLSIMGGGLKGGNTTSAGEFNFYVDPHAAHIVFKSGIPIIMAGLDATELGGINQQDIEYIRDHGGALGQLLHDISKPNFEFVRAYNQQDSINLHDAMAVLSLTNPELFEMMDTYVDVAYDNNLMRGMSLADVRPRSRKEPNAKVLVDVDQDGFKEKIISMIINGGQ